MCLIKSLYDQASIHVKVDSKLSELIFMTNDLLQREVLSPLLFSLFITDIYEFIIVRGITWSSINKLIRILILVMKADNQVDIEKILLTLKEYCDLNLLNVDLSKTKVMAF